MPNRLKQMENIQNKAQELIDLVETLNEEMQVALENIPENLQDGTNAQRAQDRIDTLEEWLEYLTNITDEVLI